MKRSLPLAVLSSVLLATSVHAQTSAAEPVPATVPAEQKASSAKPSTTRKQSTATNAAKKPVEKPDSATREPQASSAAAAATPTAKRAADRLELDPTVVTGNRELPKVLYIVPWKKAQLGDLPGQPFNTLLDEALTPVDRDVFRREVNYYKAVTSGASSSGNSQDTK